MTTQSDDFNRADSDSLGGSWTEVSGDVDIVSNAAASGSGATSYARYDSDLASSVHYAECSMNPFNAAGTHIGGPMVMYSSSANSGYVFYLRGSTSQYRVFRVTAGSLTQIGSTLSEALPAAPFTARLEIDGSGNLDATINTVSKVTGTDTTHTGNKRCGFLIGGSSSVAAIDSWEAGDVGGGGGALPAYYYHQMSA